MYALSSAAASALPFAGSDLDFNEETRTAEGLQTALDDPRARALLFYKGRPAMESSGQLLTCPPKDLIGQNLFTPGPLFVGTDGRGPVFAFSLETPPDHIPEPAFMHLRSVAGRLDPLDLALVGRAKSLLDWHFDHGYCAKCGHKSDPDKGGIMRRCASCNSEHYPRVNPVAIMLVIHEDHCLLGRGPQWPDGFYSALAGFISPGESLEEGALREIYEEVGVRAHSPQYIFSQPWPFPSQLMMGLICQADSRELTLNTAEIADAQWFSKDTIQAVYDKRSDAFMRPPRFTIAHQLLRYWLEQT